MMIRDENLELLQPAVVRVCAEVLESCRFTVA